MQLKLKRIALVAALAGLTTQMAAAASGNDASKIMGLLDRWETPAASQGTDRAVWRDMMRIQLEQANSATLDKLLEVGAGVKPELLGEFYGTFIAMLGSDIRARLDAQRAQPKRASQPVNVQSAVGATVAGLSAPDITPKTLGSSSNDQVFTPITPCRVVDTRNVGGPIGPFTARNFFYFTTSSATNWFSIQGGVNGAAGTVCSGTVITGYNPSSAVATITVTGQGGNGNLIVWQGTSPVASASTMSYPASGDTSSLATIPWGGRSGIGPGGSVEDFGVYVNAFSPTNVVIDIVGFFSAPAATVLDCQRIVGPRFEILANSGNSAVNAGAAPTCAAGYLAISANVAQATSDSAGTTSVGGYSVHSVFLVNNIGSNVPWNGTQVNCAYGNGNAFSIWGRCDVLCCRLPGH